MRSDRMEHYFDLQLRFAARFAELAGVSVSDAITSCTNLRRRFGLWGAAGESAWATFLRDVQNCSRQDLLRLAIATYERTPETPASPFGCFGYDPPGADGTLRIHFMPEERHRSTSPLSESCVHERRAELQALVIDANIRHPGVRQVRGLSWLYHLRAYKRLFPTQYVDSITAPSAPLHMNGSSTWGQVLDYQHHVKPGIVDRVLTGLTRTTLTEPWKAFPLQALSASCSIVDFLDWLE